MTTYNAAADAPGRCGSRMAYMTIDGDSDRFICDLPAPHDRLAHNDIGRGVLWTAVVNPETSGRIS